LYVVVVIRYFSDEIKYAIVFVFFNSISIKFLFPKAHWVRAYRQLFLAGDVVILPSLTVEKQKNGCKASKINACSRFLFRNDMCYCAIFFTLW